jgi:hypothetical protein
VTADEIKETAAELAAAIGDQIPQIANEAQLRDYWEYVDTTIESRRVDLWLLRTRLRRKFEPPNIPAMRAAFEKRSRSKAQRMSWHEALIDGRRGIGEKTRKHVKELAKKHLAAGTPRHEMVGWIAKTAKRSKRRVRELLLEMKL